jgi:hypothetical protein
MVFGGTAARSSAIPTPTEGMMSYRTDDDVVEVFDGSAYVGVGGAGAGGLTLINTTTFSAVASHSVNDVFSATYNNYKVIFTGTPSSIGVTLRLRLRVGGADNTASNYVFSSGVTNSAGNFANNNSSTGTTSFYTADLYGNNTNLEMTIYSPFASTNTGYQMSGQHQTSTNATGVQFGGGAMTVTTSYTGFTLFASTGNITGDVTVYGYNS